MGDIPPCILLGRWRLCVKEGKVHTCTGTEALYRPYGPLGGVEVKLYCTGTEALYRPYGT